jgi:hypothetical protein
MVQVALVWDEPQSAKHAGVHTEKARTTAHMRLLAMHQTVA